MKSSAFKALFIIPLFSCILHLTVNAQEPLQWVSYESPSFNFKIDFPKTPFDVIDTLETEFGDMMLNVAELDCSEEEGYSNLVYMINCTVYPDTLIHSDFTEMLESFFGNTINGAVTNISGELLSESVVNYTDYPGREVRIAGDDGLTVFITRMYLIKSQFFMMIILSDAGKENNSNITKFFDSFSFY